MEGLVQLESRIEDRENNIDKTGKIIYNISKNDDKDIFSVSKKSKHSTEKNNPIKITRNYVNHSPTQNDIHKLQNEVQYILLSNINKNQ